MPFTRTHGIARLQVSVLAIEFVPTYVPWTYDGMTYDLKVKIEGTTETGKGGRGTDEDMTEGDGEQKDDTMDHDKRDDIPKAVGQHTQTMVAPADKGTAPSSTPMAGLRFSSFGAASAPSRLWGGRAEAEDPAEHELPPFSPAMSPVRLSPVRGGTPGHVAPFLSPPALQVNQRTHQAEMEDAVEQEQSPAVPLVRHTPSMPGRVSMISTPIGVASPRHAALARPPQSPQPERRSSPVADPRGSPRQAASTPLLLHH